MAENLDKSVKCQDIQSLAESRKTTLREMEIDLLGQGLIPRHYMRNIEAISREEQAQLLLSRVGVCGCGGLGLYVVNHLVRMGVGHITLWDPDVFSESNLNRQLWSNYNHLGVSKVEVCRQEAAKINPAVDITPLKSCWETNADDLLLEQDVVIDALDNISSRLRLAEKCGKNSIPLVHAAIGGWYGQITVIMPGDDTLFDIYGVNNGRGLEEELGTLSFAAAFAASIQAAEAVKLILGKESELRSKICMFDLLEPELVFLDKCNMNVT